ncbi:hypothetical protein NSA36_03795 [Anaerotruncus colihominis]|nr:hypothetical protein [Anaerotruncus colihominis]
MKVILNIDEKNPLENRCFPLAGKRPPLRQGLSNVRVAAAVYGGNALFF